jgi:hypothetical protein
VQVFTFEQKGDTMKTLVRFFWGIRVFFASLRIGYDITKEAMDRDYTPEQAAGLYEHRMEQWARAHAKGELQ